MKPIKGEDRRVGRTRHMLREALFGLMQERGYESIGVGDITERANVGRATFYLHYRDKEELLEESLESILRDLETRFSPLSAQTLLLEHQTLAIKVFEHVSEHQRLYRVLLGERNTGGFLNRLRTHLSEIAKRFAISQLIESNPNNLPQELIANYASGALLGLIIWWLQNNMPYSADYMGNLFWELSAPGLANTLDLPISKTKVWLKPQGEPNPTTQG